MLLPWHLRILKLQYITILFWGLIPLLVTLSLPFCVFSFFFPGSIAFLGFSGKFKPSWTRLFKSPAGQGLGLIESYIPLQQEAYECRRVSTSKRKDVDLLKKALNAH